MAPTTAAAGRQRETWAALQPVELHFGDDLRDPALHAAIVEQLEPQQPDLVVLAPPCGPWSALQSPNDPEEAERKRAADRVFWRFVRTCWDVQCRHGALVLTEQPAGSRALRLPEMEGRPHLCRARVSQ